MKTQFLRLVMLATILVLILSACSAGEKSTAAPTLLPPAPTPAPTEDPNVEKTIAQVESSAITIDGDLAEWTGSEWHAVANYYNGHPKAPSPDLDVKAAFAFDVNKFYLAVKTLDDSIQQVDRSWRYGDGFYFTLVTDENKAKSSYVYQFAFDQQVMFLLFGNGEFLPPFDTQEIEYKFQQRSDGMDYEVAIPIKLLKPFNPFIYTKAAINVVYSDRDSNGGMESVMICPDADFDKERNNERKGRFFSFKVADPQAGQESSYHAVLSRNFFQDGEAVELRYAVHAAKEQAKMKIRVVLTGEGAEEQQDEITLDVQPGLTSGTFPLTLGDHPSGTYTLRVAFVDQDGNRASEITKKIFILNRGEIEKTRASFSAYQGQPELAASLSNVEIRFDWLDEFYQRSHYQDISALSEWWDDIDYLISRLEKGEPALFPANTIKRYAHRSKIDNTLQPYSVYLPEGFDGNTQYPLLVFLHGSGGDERSQMPGLAEAFAPLGYPILGPRARGLSSDYLGVSGEDVFECIEHFTSLYPNIRKDRIFLMGFSMGGTGTWRLGLLRPDYFRGLMILSGRVTPEILHQVDKLRNQNIFVVHGAKDLAVPISTTRVTIAELKALNLNIQYIEYPEGGHGDYIDEELLAKLIAWIRKYGE